jgi:hypothetical protein
MAKLKDRASDARPYLERALKDERVREDVKSAITTARDIYDELIGSKALTGVAARVATDKDIQESLRDAIDDLRDAADRVQGKGQHKGRNTTLLFTGIILGVLFNPVTGPGTRRWLQETLFGGSDEFEYRSDGGSNSS